RYPAALAKSCRPNAWIMPCGRVLKASLSAVDPLNTGQKATVLTTNRTNAIVQPKPARHEDRKGPMTSSAQRSAKVTRRHRRGRETHLRGPALGRACSRHRGAPTLRAAAGSALLGPRRSGDPRRAAARGQVLRPTLPLAAIR